MNTDGDKDLVFRLHDDDIGAFDMLYQKYHQAIYRNIFKLTKDDDIARDILQDVFVALWEKRVDINPDQSVSGWLFVLSFNKSVSYLRKKVRETTVVNTMPFSEMEADGSDVQLLDEQYYLLQQAINQLSPQRRKVFTLCKLEGKTYEEAAEKLNLSKHTVKEYLGHAVVAVKNHIKENHAEWKTAGVMLVCYWVGMNQ
ncbi:RNA polymerase sigma-70 factor, ECF subfamily [Mucilaginibacter gossypiicola]|uniref:RNA polymerase sigma-70 factor, ECF subfamily n=1 Tax=Mucilaginibacter gossypiicola TaxID=551995 RepID=A0A1H8LDH6_9SPHI|nr:sigma-70 family RNA polymerase sigma factor [Mucilaginibacter gossypiicola]SEO03177.1 RNA polymerase sigma-70 factor, ECF subfamily [Mucilaginibacter gossypiicola]